MSETDYERIRGVIVDRFDPTDQSNSQTVVTFEDHEVNEYDMEDEKVLERFRRNSGLRPEVTESNKFMNKSEEMVLEFQEDTRAETVFHRSPEILEGNNKSSSASSNSDVDSNLSRYYFDGSFPVSSAHVEESETKMPLLCPKQPTSWRNCCGLLELLRASSSSDP